MQSWKDCHSSLHKLFQTLNYKFSGDQDFRLKTPNLKRQIFAGKKHLLTVCFSGIDANRSHVRQTINSPSNVQQISKNYELSSEYVSSCKSFLQKTFIYFQKRLGKAPRRIPLPLLVRYVAHTAVLLLDIVLQVPLNRNFNLHWKSS